MSKSTEVWLPVCGYEDLYWVSDKGRVKSKKCILKPDENAKGYYRVKLWLNGKSKNKSIHSLVITAFSGSRPKGMVARHLDGNKHNNKSCNLKWGTPSENQQDRKLHGTDENGERAKNAKFTNKQVGGIRRRYVRYCLVNGGAAIAREYNVSKRTISSMVTGKTYNNTALDQAIKKLEEM